MEFDTKGNAHLSPEEHMATGRIHQREGGEPIPAALLDPTVWNNSLKARGARIEARMAADDDDLTHAERAAIGFERADLARDTQIVSAMTEQLLEHTIERAEAFAAEAVK
jgi:hypothetical protein